MIQLYIAQYAGSSQSMFFDNLGPGYLVFVAFSFIIGLLIFFDVI